MGEIEDVIKGMADTYALESTKSANVVTDAAKAGIQQANPYNTFIDIAKVAGTTAIASTTAQAVKGEDVDMAELLGITAISGLLGGTMQSFGADYDGILQDRYAQSRQDLAKGGTGEVEGLPTSLFNIARQDDALFKMQRASEVKDLLSGVAVTGMNKQVGKGDYFQQMSASERQKIVAAQGIITALAKVSDRYGKLGGMNFARLKAEGIKAGTEANRLNSAMIALVGPVLKLSAESGNFAISERAAALQSMKGSDFNDSDDVARQLNELARMYQGMIVSQLDAAKAGYELGGDALRGRLVNMFEPTGGDGATPVTTPGGQAQPTEEDIRKALEAEGLTGSKIEVVGQ